MSFGGNFGEKPYKAIAETTTPRALWKRRNRKRGKYKPRIFCKLVIKYGLPCKNPGTIREFGLPNAIIHVSANVEPLVII